LGNFLEIHTICQSKIHWKIIFFKILDEMPKNLYLKLCHITLIRRGWISGSQLGCLEVVLGVPPNLFGKKGWSVNQKRLIYTGLDITVQVFKSTNWNTLTVYILIVLKI